MRYTFADYALPLIQKDYSTASPSHKESGLPTTFDQDLQLAMSQEENKHYEPLSVEKGSTDRLSHWFTPLKESIKPLELISNDGMIVAIPGSDKGSLNRMVASRIGTVPHNVTTVKNGLFKCDSSCNMF